jgi:maltose-binding protein MalE
MTILIHMIDAQDRWFRQEIQGFAERNDIELNFVGYERLSDVESTLRLEKESKIRRIGLVKTHKDMVGPLAADRLVLPLSEIVPEQQLQEDLSDYLTVATNLGMRDGEVFYLPRKLETNTLLFLKSRVAEAVRNWKRHKAEINEMFRRHNGYGLPRDYRLEGQPDEWDWYDLAVVSYYWANTHYHGATRARTAHRGRIYAGTMTEIATKIFQAGGDSRTLLFGNDSPTAVYDAFEWEAFFRENGLYNAGMWNERWDGQDIWGAMSKGEVFMAFMHQIDAYFIHGTSATAGYINDPDDMGTAIMPRGVSLELDNGNPVRQGSHSSNLSGWWWGIPTTSPSPKLSYELARYITSRDFHSKEVGAFGMMPIRNDIAQDLEKHLNEKWMRDVFATANRQLDAEVYEIPAVRQWPAIQDQWLAAWDEIVVRRNYGPEGRVDRAHIQSVLAPYAEKIRLLALGEPLN